MTSESSSVVFGFHAVEAALKQNPKNIRRLYLLSARKDKRLQAIQASAKKYQLNIEWVDRTTLDQLAQGNHQGVIAEVVSAVDTYDEAYLKSHLLKPFEVLLKAFNCFSENFLENQSLKSGLLSGHCTVRVSGFPRL